MVSAASGAGEALVEFEQNRAAPIRLLIRLEIVDQLAGVALVDLAIARPGRARQIVELQRVLLEAQHREMTVAEVALLARAVDQQEARPVGGVGDGAALGEDGHRLVGLPLVIDQDALQIAVVVAALDIDHQLVREGVEDAVLDQHRGEAVANLELQILEGAVGGR